MKQALYRICTAILLIGLLATLMSANVFADEENPPAPPTPWDGESTADDFASGDGSFGDPYVISTPEEFNYFAQFVQRNGISAKKYFILTSDLDFGGHTIVPVGSQNSQFKGIFDGRGHTISNYKMHTDLAGDYLALFANINGADAVVKNFTLADATYTGSGKIYVGAVAAFCTNGTISNIKLESTVKIELKGEAVNGSTGGVAARHYGLIQYVVSEATVIVENGKENTQNFVGGLVGATGKGTGVISDCIVRGEVKTTLAYTGGISGIMGVTTEGLLRNCYNFAKVTSTFAAGGITGRFHTNACTLEGCYNLSDDIAGPEGKTGTIIGDVNCAGTVTGCGSIAVPGLGYYGPGYNTDVDVTGFELTETTAEALADQIRALEEAIALNAAEEAKITYTEDEQEELTSDTVDLSDFPTDPSVTDEETDPGTTATSESGIGTRPSGNGKTEESATSAEPAGTTGTGTEEQSSAGSAGCKSVVATGGIFLILAALGCAILPGKSEKNR